MAIENLGHEYEFEPQFGLPERLPSDEFIVWQGSPDVAALAYSAFHFKKLALYFAALILVCAWPALEGGAGYMAVLSAIKWIAPLAVIGMATLWALAYFTARTTVYTVTNKRVVMRLGIVLTVTFNLPFKQIVSADVRAHHNGFGDITLALKGADRIGWVHLWPHNRPWHMKHPQPSLRCVANASEAGRVLAQAWSVLRNSPMAAPEATLAPANSTPQGVQTQWA